MRVGLPGLRLVARSTNAALNGSSVVRGERLGPLVRSPAAAARRGSGCRGRTGRAGSPGSMSPEGSEIAERRSLDQRDDAAPSRDALALDVHGCGMVHAILAESRRIGAYARRSDAHRRDRAAVVRGPADRIRRHRARRRRSSPTAWSSAVTTSRCSRAAGSQTKATLVSARSSSAPDPALLGNVWFDVYHALTAYLDADDSFDVVHDHSGSSVRRWGRCSAGSPPVVHTLHGPWTEPTRRYYSLLQDKHLHLVAISDVQRGDFPTISATRRPCTTASTSSRTRTARTRTTSSSTSVGRTPDKGPLEAIEVARRAGTPAQDAREAQRTVRAARTGTRSSRRSSTTTSRCSSASTTR